MSNTYRCRESITRQLKHLSSTINPHLSAPMIHLRSCCFGTPSYLVGVNYPIETKLKKHPAGKAVSYAQTDLNLQLRPKKVNFDNKIRFEKATSYHLWKIILDKQIWFILSKYFIIVINTTFELNSNFLMNQIQFPQKPLGLKCAHSYCLILLCLIVSRVR